jgi:hypothetical protein
MHKLFLRRHQVLDNCGNPITPTGPVVGPDPVCSGTKTYTWTYADCGGGSGTWVYTYTYYTADLRIAGSG